MQQRDLRLDLLRIVAIVAVIWLHVSGEVVVREPGPGDADWWFGNIADAFSRWSVPLFVMASGALLLPQRPDIAPLAFYRRRAARILVPTLFWTVFYLALRAIDDGASIKSLVISVVRGTPYYHLWFLYMIAGLYIAAPLISRFLEASSQYFVLGATVLVFVVSSIESLMAGVVDEERAYTFLGMWPGYVGYFLAGYYLWRWPLAGIPRGTALMVAVACGAGIALLTAALYKVFGARVWQITYANLQPLVVVMSLAIFTLAQRAAMERRSELGRAVTATIPLVLGIYVMHPLWLLALKAAGIDAYLIHPAIGIPVTTGLAFALSAVSARAICAVPLLRNAI